MFTNGKALHAERQRHVPHAAKLKVPFLSIFGLLQHVRMLVSVVCVAQQKVLLKAIFGLIPPAQRQKPVLPVVQSVVLPMGTPLATLLQFRNLHADKTVSKKPFALSATKRLQQHLLPQEITL
jgi:hypothetical protein